MAAGFWQETKVQTWRWFLHSKRRPVVVISGLFQPVIFMTLFVLVFKKNMGDALGGGPYLDFVTPGALLFTAFNASLNAGVPVLFDREMGFLDRLRAAPLVDRFSIVLSSAIHIAVMTLLQCMVIVVGTTVLGVSFQGGFGGADPQHLLLSSGPLFRGEHGHWIARGAYRGRPQGPGAAAASLILSPWFTQTDRRAGRPLRLAGKPNR